MKKIRKNKMLLEQRIMWLVVLVLLAICCFFGYIQYKNIRSKIGYPIKNITNENLGEEHCLEDICINDLKISYYEDGISTISGNMYHTSEETKDVCVKIQFLKEGTTDTYDFNTCYYQMTPHENVYIETYFSEEQKDLVFSKDYRLTYLNSQELDQLYRNRDEELSKITG